MDNYDIEITVDPLDYEKMKAERLEVEEEFKFVASFMHYAGTNSKSLTDKQYVEVFELADGYGDMTLEHLVELELLGDWSHVRDSSKEAVLAMYNKLKSYGF